MDLEVGPALTIPAAELRWRFSRSSGPGGQHVNTSDSRVQLTWSPAESLVLTDHSGRGSSSGSVGAWSAARSR